MTGVANLAVPIALVARVAIGLMFICSSARLTRLIAKAVAGLTARGLPAARPLLYVAMAYKLIAGLFLIAGFMIVPTALSLIAYTLFASWLMLDFWNKSGPERVGAENGVQANLGIIAALLLLIAWSLAQHAGSAMPSP